MPSKPLDQGLTYSALILAGGQGRRMGGHDKGWVDWAGRPLIAHAHERVVRQTLAPTEVLISANRHLAQYATLGASVVQDFRAGFAGPLAGIESGLRHAQSDWVLVTACDMPLIPLNLFEKLYDGVGDSGVAVAAYQQKLSPLTILLSRFLLQSLTAYLDSGRAAVKPWLESIGAAVVEFSDPESFANINSLKETHEQSTKRH